MKDEVVTRINGWMTLLRLILPAMVMLMLFWVSDIRGNTQQMRTDLNNHMQKDYRIISSRLARIEQQLGIPPR